MIFLRFSHRVNRIEPQPLVRVRTRWASSVAGNCLLVSRSGDGRRMGGGRSRSDGSRSSDGSHRRWTLVPVGLLLRFVETN